MIAVIIWGRKLRNKYLGIVADFCPICRDIKACRLLKLNIVSHLYYIPIGKGDDVGYITVCRECGYEANTDFNKYTTTIKTKNNAIDNLIQDTFPSIKNYYKDRLDLEARLKYKQLNAEERLNLIIEPFILLENVVLKEIPENTTHLDEWDILVIIIAIIALVMSSYFLGTVTSKLLGLLMLGISFSALIFLLVSAFQEKTAKRLALKKISPYLIKALKDINPSLQELQECSNRLPTNLYRISKLIKIDELYQNILQYKNK